MGQAIVDLGRLSRESVGVFGWLDTTPPIVVHLGWGAMLCVLLALGFLLGRRFERRLLGAIGLGVLGTEVAEREPESSPRSRRLTELARVQDVARTPPRAAFVVDLAVDVDLAQVGIGNVGRVADRTDLTALEPHRGVAEVPNRRQGVGHDDDRLPCVAQVGHPFEALALELLVADRQHLVDEQHVGIDVDRHREAEAHIHARRVVLHRRVDEALEPGEAHDVIEALVELASSTARGARR